MIKNVVDVVFGTLTYWAVGYGLTFGTGEGANWFTGVGSFFLDPGKAIIVKQCPLYSSCT